MQEANIIYSEEKKGYLLLLEENVMDELCLSDQRRKPYEVYHTEQSSLEELAGEIRLTWAIYDAGKRSMLRRARIRKAFLILILVPVLSMVFVNRQVAACLNINLLLFNLVVTLVGIAVFCSLH